MKKILGSVLALAVLAAIWGLFTVRSLAPTYDFALTSDAVEALVDVLFDDHGIPHICAASEADAVYALGYVHVSERLWQMDLLRRAGAGELSALLGEDMVENDRYLRMLGMREVAVKEAKRFDAEAPDSLQEVMAAYLEGVNAFISGGARPLEYRLVGADPQPWWEQPSGAQLRRVARGAGSLCARSTARMELGGQAVAVHHVKDTPDGANGFDLNEWQSGIGGNWMRWWVESGSLFEAEADAPNCTSAVRPSARGESMDYPNPASDRFKVVCGEGAQVREVGLVDGRGAVHRLNASALGEVDAAGLANGLYHWFLPGFPGLGGRLVIRH